MSLLNALRVIDVNGVHCLRTVLKFAIGENVVHQLLVFLQWK